MSVRLGVPMTPTLRAIGAASIFFSAWGEALGYSRTLQVLPSGLSWNNGTSSTLSWTKHYSVSTRTTYGSNNWSKRGRHWGSPW